MKSFSMGDDERMVEQKENGTYVLHSRSKSASDRTADTSRFGASCSLQCNQNLSLDSPFSTRTYGSQTPPNGQSLDSSSSSSNHRASLEKDVYQLQSRLQQEKSMRIMLEKAMGRASSALSPGHRHFASQTRELIAEIELLEEEVANKEQHVLALYRNIFEQCVSQPSSVQTSSMSSPVRHTKSKARKHPSIISSSFCSSKKFPLRGLRSFSGKKDGDKVRHISLCSGKMDVHYEKPCSNPIKFQVHEKSTDRIKTSGVRTLKDYLNQCPSKLSEEMVKCMAAVYCWLCSEASTKSDKSGNNLLSVASKSCGDLAPQHGSQNSRTSKPMVEISSMPTNKKHFSRASYAINSYRTLVEQLEKVNVSQMEADAQVAFWINIYNSLIMHAYLAYGIPHNSLRRLALFHKAAYNIGGIIITANTIEHTIFCYSTPRMGRWVETILSTAFRKKSGQEKELLGSKLRFPDSRFIVCFGLCTGAFSDPVLKVYTAANVRDELEQAKKEFLQANILVKKSKVYFPKLLERFSRESSMGLEELLKWVCENVDRKLRDSIQQCIDSKNSKKASQIIEWLPYSSKFRYAFSEGLALKPWWM